jgi:hypothetical protein
MANEITISAVSGLTIALQLYSGAAPVESPFAATEIGSTGEYVADMPTGVPFGKYLVLATVEDEKLGSAEMWWDGAHEITESMAMMRGLDPANPWTVTTTQEYAGDIVIEAVGDNVTSNTFTRQ